VPKALLVKVKRILAHSSCVPMSSILPRISLYASTAHHQSRDSVSLTAHRDFLLRIPLPCAIHDNRARKPGLLLSIATTPSRKLGREIKRISPANSNAAHARPADGGVHSHCRHDPEATAAPPRGMTLDAARLWVDSEMSFRQAVHRPRHRSAPEFDDGQHGPEPKDGFRGGYPCPILQASQQTVNRGVSFASRRPLVVPSVRDTIDGRLQC
jgi:hypothetical protein